MPSARSGHNAAAIVGVATAFNILFEYSMRGANGFVAQPRFVIFLVVAYASLFTMEEGLIRRFRLRDWHLLVLAWTYGMIYQGLVSGAAFIAPEFLGIRWSYSIFVIVAWWGGIQSVLTFYLATRVVPRDWSAPQLGRGGWVAAAAINVANIGLFQLSGRIPHGTPAGYVTMLAVAAAASVAFVLVVRRSPRQAPSPRPILAVDLLAAVTVVLFAGCALFATSEPGLIGTSRVNADAVRTVVRWTLIACAALVATRVIARRPIPV